MAGAGGGFSVPVFRPDSSLMTAIIQDAARIAQPPWHAPCNKIQSMVEYSIELEYPIEYSNADIVEIVRDGAATTEVAEPPARN